ncbi:MAG: AroB-related putative sugar phosphate phospholyase (cyclizing) [Patescibacteria group bacterium]
MSKRIAVKSIFRDYSAEFVDDFRIPLKTEIQFGGVLVIDSNVFRIYKKDIESVLGGSKPIMIEASEENKTIDTAKRIIETLVENGVRRDQKIVAVGGGVIQDITAFAASIIYRGIDWVFFPTTLLAQADSCIGSKTSLNLSGKKNLIGNFYPPARIFIDTKFTESLSEEDIKSGIGEMMHFYLYANSPYFKKLISNYETLLKNRSELREYIFESLSIKKVVVETDEFDKGERNKFNYGHTFGHALEATTDYKINHGQGVTVGMDLANFVSVKMGLMPQGLFDELHAAFKINFPSYALNSINLEKYFMALSKDKKNIGTNVGCILSEGPGKLLKKQMSLDDTFKGWIKEYFSDK